MNIITRVLIFHYIPTIFLGFPVWGSNENPFQRCLSQLKVGECMRSFWRFRGSGLGPAVSI